MNDSVVYEYALNELKAKRIVKGLLAKAVANSDGDTKKTKSLYIKYRVKHIKAEFANLGIEIDGKTLQQLDEFIKTKFIDKLWREEQLLSKKERDKEIEREEKEKERVIKYGRFKGLLLPFAALLGVWIVVVAVYSLMYLIKVVDYVNYSGEGGLLVFGFYIQLIILFSILLFSWFFYKKLQGVKVVAIIFFAQILLSKLIDIYVILEDWDFRLSILVDRDYFGLVTASIILCVISFASIMYFLKSNRVNQTFIHEPGDGSILAGIAFAMTAPLLMYIYYFFGTL